MYYMCRYYVCVRIWSITRILDKPLLFATTRRVLFYNYSYITRISYSYNGNIERVLSIACLVVIVISAFYMHVLVLSRFLFFWYCCLVLIWLPHLTFQAAAFYYLMEHKMHFSLHESSSSNLCGRQQRTLLVECWDNQNQNKRKDMAAQLNLNANKMLMYAVTSWCPLLATKQKNKTKNNKINTKQKKNKASNK